MAYCRTVAKTMIDDYINLFKWTFARCILKDIISPEYASPETILERMGRPWITNIPNSRDGTNAHTGSGDIVVAVLFLIPNLFWSSIICTRILIGVLLKCIFFVSLATPTFLGWFLLFEFHIQVPQGSNWTEL